MRNQTIRRLAVAAILSTAAGALAGLAAPASAQERAPFTGPRVELNAGYDRTDGDRPAAGTPDKLDGLWVGGAAGYDLALGSTLRLGAEGGIGWNVNDGARGVAGTTTYRLSSGRDIDLSLRLGAVVAPRTLVYAKAGYANSRYTGSVRTGAANSPAVRASANEEGLRLGAGVEQMLSDDAYLKGEYRYTSFGQGAERHQLLAGVGYRF